MYNKHVLIIYLLLCFTSWITFLIPEDYREKIGYIHTNLSAILSVYNSNQTINTSARNIVQKYILNDNCRIPLGKYHSIFT